MNVKLVLILLASYSSQHLDEFKIIRYNNQLRIAQNTVKGTDKMKDFINQMLKFNKTFVEEGKYKEFMTYKVSGQKSSYYFLYGYKTDSSFTGCFRP